MGCSRRTARGVLREDGATIRHPNEAATGTVGDMAEVIYFIQSRDGGPIKIGLSRRPVKRLKSLQIGRHDELQIIAQAHGTLGDEQKLHSRFARYRLHGEWFEPCEELMAMSRWAWGVLIWTCLLTYGDAGYIGALRRGLLPRPDPTTYETGHLAGFLLWAAGLYVWTVIDRRRHH